MTDPNPYSPPQTSPEHQPPAELPPDGKGLWRQDDLLVMHRATKWPARCVVTGGPSSQVVSWTIGLYPSATVDVSVSAVYLAWYRWALVFVVGTFVVFMEEAIRWKFFEGANVAGEYGPWALAIAGVIVPGVLYLANLCPLVVHHVQGEYVWLRGVSPAFLALLPEWPYEER